MGRQFFMAIALLLGGLALPSTAAPLPTLSFCDDANEWPPYTQYRREGGQRTQELTGFTVELLRLLGLRLGFEPRIDMLPWKRCQEAVRQGERLGLLNAIRTPERERDFLISPVIYETRLLVLWQRSQFPQGLTLRTQTDLLPLRIGALHGYSYSQLDAVPSERLIRAPNYGSLLQMLKLQRVDVALINEGVLLGLAAQEQLPADWDRELVRGEIADRLPSRFHLMFSRKHPQADALHQSITQELQQMQRSGELARLRNQWLGSLP